MSLDHALVPKKLLFAKRETEIIIKYGRRRVLFKRNAIKIWINRTPPCCFSTLNQLLKQWIYRRVARDMGEEESVFKTAIVTLY